MEGVEASGCLPCTAMSAEGTLQGRICKVLGGGDHSGRGQGDIPFQIMFEMFKIELFGILKSHHCCW